MRSVGGVGIEGVLDQLLDHAEAGRSTTSPAAIWLTTRSFEQDPDHELSSRQRALVTGARPAGACLLELQAQGRALEADTRRASRCSR